MKKIKKHKILKRITISIFGLILLGILGLIVNNRVFAVKYNKLSTDGDTLTSSEVLVVKGVYDYLNAYGDDIFKGFNGNTDLIIYNDKYEFLICDNNSDAVWELIDNNTVLNKRIYRRNAENPQAFAVSVNDKWVGSMSTKNTFNKTMANSVPVFFPIQVMTMDDELNKAVVIHEMVHAFQANNNSERFGRIKNLHSICENYYDDESFNEMIVQEASYLEEAISAEKIEDVIEYAKKFLETRDRRRAECKMSTAEIQDEVNFEWLEGLARYAEYKASADSKSLVARNLQDIDQKVKIKADDRYYTLGMAQALVLDKLQEDWKKDLFTGYISMEECLKTVCELKYNSNEINEITTSDDFEIIGKTSLETACYISVVYMDGYANSPIEWLKYSRSAPESELIKGDKLGEVTLDLKGFVYTCTPPNFSSTHNVGTEIYAIKEMKKERALKRG